jgi:hypothetical protein
VPPAPAPLGPPERDGTNPAAGKAPEELPWYWRRAREEIGPVHLNELRNRYHSGNLRPLDEICNDPRSFLDTWRPVWATPEIFSEEAETYRAMMVSLMPRWSSSTRRLHRMHLPIPPAAEKRPRGDMPGPDDVPPSDLPAPPVGETNCEREVWHVHTAAGDLYGPLDRNTLLLCTALGRVRPADVLHSNREDTWTYAAHLPHLQPILRQLDYDVEVDRTSLPAAPEESRKIDSGEIAVLLISIAFIGTAFAGIPTLVAAIVANIQWRRLKRGQISKENRGIILAANGICWGLFFAAWMSWFWYLYLRHRISL